MKHLSYIYNNVLGLLLCLLAVLPLSAQTVLTGHVVDESNGESIPFATVQYKGRQLAVISDGAGRFSIPHRKGWRLTVSAVGFKTRTYDIADDTRRLFVSLKPDTRQLTEVTIRAKRRRYSRKNNPAVELMHRVIAAKRTTSLKQRDFYSFMKYQKLTLALNDMDPKLFDNPKLKKYSWLTDQIEQFGPTGKLILPASVEETVTRHLYRRDPRSEKVIVEGHQSAGINDFFQTGDILNSVTRDVFTDVNIYDEQVRLLQHPFTSPIADGAISFYRYYIEDTVQIERDSCIHLHFLPNNQQDFGFRGDLYILKDSSYQVRRCELVLPNQTDVNFVENLKVIQEFSQLPDGSWVLSADDMIVELVLFDFIQKGVAIRTTRLSDYDFQPIADRLFHGRARQTVHPDAELQDEDYWQQHRKAQLSRSEQRMGNFLNSIRQTGGFRYAMLALKLLMENFIETGAKSKVDIGPVNSMVSTNFIDGLRTRLSLQTTANLSPHIFWKGFAARGWKSQKTYYSSLLTWSLNRKKYLPDEFPKRNVQLLSTYDVMSPSDKFLSTDKDNMFTAFKWKKVDKMMFYNRQQLSFEYEQSWGLRTLLSIKAERNEPAGNMLFEPVGSHASGAGPAAGFRTTELRAEVEYSPGAVYTNSKQRRLKVNREAPVFTVSHTMGVSGLFGSDYHYHYSEASIFKRFWLNSWGRIDLYTRGGVQWSQVPFPLLCMPAANLSYISQKQMFNLISDMEFLNDRFVSIDMNWDMQGKLFNRLPLIRRLHWREYIGAKLLWGALSDKNNPMLASNADSGVLMVFPENSRLMNPEVPYWEISLGVRSIFRFFQIEYVRRMNYNRPAHNHKNSVRLGFTLMF